MRTRLRSYLGVATTLAIGLVGSLGISEKSFAVIISQTAGYPTSLLSSTPTAFTNQPLYPPLTLFNPGLGTLNSVQISFQATGNGSFAVENTDVSSSPTVSVTQGATLSFNLPTLSVNPFNIVLTQFSGSATLGPFDGTPDFMGPSSFTFNGFNETPSPTVVTFTDPTDLLAFSGIGTLPATLTGLGTSSSSGSGALNTFVQTNAGGTLTLTYDYTPAQVQTTPEASTTVGLILLGGLSLAKSLKRRES